MERWDVVCLGKVFTWAGHVARFAKWAPDRLALRVLQYRGIGYLRALEEQFGQQLHRRQFHAWRWEGQFSSMFGTRWADLTFDGEEWMARRHSWIQKRLNDRAF